MLYSTYLVNLQSLFLLTVFTIISFLDINRKDSFEKKIFLICNFLTFLSFFNFFLIIIPIDDVSQISKILQLSLIIISLSYFLLCLINFNFVRLRLLYIPYVLLFYVVCSLFICVAVVFSVVCYVSLCLCLCFLVVVLYVLANF